MSKIIDQVKTFEDACKITGDDPTSPRFVFTPGDNEDENDVERRVIAFRKIAVIVKALREGWTPNWDDSNWKYYPYFRMGPGFRFRDAGIDYDYTYSYVGSRLCVPTYELANHLGEQFTDLYKDYLN